MKDSVTKFNFDDAFKALDEIEIPKAPKGIRANRENLHETLKRVDKFELLFEDFYDVNNSEDMNAASEEREAEVAKAKLARIEKIVDLDAETEDDILPSYVGKTIIQCPQCMTLFYKDAEDISRDESNTDLVNIGEVCQHCGNDSGYDVIGKVAEETEEVPADNFAEEETTTEETGNGENDLSVDDNTAAEESGEADELSAEVDLDTLDLDELELEEEPEEEEEVEESLNTSELLKKIEDKNELKTEHGSEKLTLNEENKNVVSKETDQVCSVIENGKDDHEYFTGTEEECKAWIEDQNKTDAGKLRNWSVKKSAHVAMVESIEDNLDDKLKAHEEYIKELRDTINELEKKLASTKNEQIKTSIQSRIDAAKAELEKALPEAVKVEVETEELPDAEEAGMEDATDNTTEENDADETATESLHEAAIYMRKADWEKLNQEVEAARAEVVKYNIPMTKNSAGIEEPNFNAVSEDKREAAKNAYDKYQKATKACPSLSQVIFQESLELQEAKSIVGKDNWDKFMKFTKLLGIKTINDLDKFIADNNVGENDDIVAALEEASKKEVKESVHNSKAQEEAEQKSDLKSDKDSTKLTLNEADNNGISKAEFEELINTFEPISSDEVRGYFKKYESLDDTKEPDNKEEPSENNQASDDQKPETDNKTEVTVTAKIDKEITEADIKKLSEVTEIDDESFNKKLSESLKAVYENVKGFEMTDCTLTEDKIIIEGVISFNSGKSKVTNYIFESRQINNANIVILNGANKDLFECGKIRLTANIINETLQAKALKYRYSIDEHLVEGLIR